VHLASGRVREAVREARETERLAAPMRQRDVLFQAAQVAVKCLKIQRQETEARDEAKRALGHLEEMRQDLSATDLRTFLTRPKSIEFKTEALSLFQGAEQAAEAARLEALFRP
jgi:anion-transporting  ArsA/GET3 family ATPase